MRKNDATSPDPIELLHQLEHNEEWKRQLVSGTGLDPHMALLRQWQSERLARTYADFVADKHYRPTCQFFLSDIYAPRDFSQRDHDLERIYAILSRFFPDYMLRLLVSTIKLNELTKKLDNALLHALVDDLGVTDTITPQLYAEGYRICSNYYERVRQIDLIVKIIKEVDVGARMPGVGLAMRLGKGPAKRAGWSEVYDFLERGYVALKTMRDASPFVSAVDQREKCILDQIFAGDPDPFDIEKD